MSTTTTATIAFRVLQSTEYYSVVQSGPLLGSARKQYYRVLQRNSTAVAPFWALPENRILEGTTAKQHRRGPLLGSARKQSIAEYFRVLQPNSTAVGPFWALQETRAPQSTTAYYSQTTMPWAPCKKTEYYRVLQSITAKQQRRGPLLGSARKQSATEYFRVLQPNSNAVGPFWALQENIILQSATECYSLQCAAEWAPSGLCKKTVLQSTTAKQHRRGPPDCV